MRIGLVLLPLLAASAPAFAQAAPPPEIPPALADPRTTEQLVNVVQSMSKVLLDMPVGEFRAAAEGREPTAAERQVTVRQQTGLSERQLRAQIDAARPMLVRGMQAMARALPHMMKSLDGVEQSLERATANIPDPTYPRR